MKRTIYHKHFFIFLLLCTSPALLVAQGAWMQRADLGNSSIRAQAVAFTIGTKAYLGTGYEASISNYVKDFWEYDPVNDTWTQKANFGGVARSEAFGFGIGTKGYIGGGWNGLSFYNDFWEYNTTTNTWTQ